MGVPAPCISSVWESHTGHQEGNAYFPEAAARQLLLGNGTRTVALCSILMNTEAQGTCPEATAQQLPEVPYAFVLCSEGHLSLDQMPA